MKTEGYEPDFRIIARQLAQNYPKLGNGSMPQFPQFVQYIIDREATWMPPKGAKLHQPPTELEKKLLKPPYWHNRHMEPMHRICTPCQAEFKVITKVRVCIYIYSMDVYITIKHVCL